MPPWSHSKPEETPIAVQMEELQEKGELTVCSCGKKIWKFWHRKTGPKGNTTYPLMDFCAPCTFNN